MDTSVSRVIYIFPLLADCIVGQVLFVGTVRAAQMGYSDTVVTSMLSIWGATYVIACFIFSRILSQKNAPMLASLGCLVFFVTSVMTPLFSGIVSVAGSMFAMGIGTGLFFPRGKPNT